MLRYSYSLFIFKANNEVARVNTTSLKITGNLRKTKKKRILNGTRAAVPSEWEINLFYRFHLCDSSVFIHSIANWKGTQLSCQLRLMQCRLDLAGDSIAAIRPFGFITKLHLCRHCEEFVGLFNRPWDSVQHIRRSSVLCPAKCQSQLSDTKSTVCMLQTSFETPIN